MNAPQSVHPVFGRVDAEGRLVEADPPLLRLQERAGGVRGGMLAVPQLFKLTRLARRLAIPISRQILAAQGEQDLGLWVMVRPVDDQVELSITGWQENAPLQPSPALEALRWRDFSRASADWIIETDAMLRVTHSPNSLPTAIGQPVEALFALSRDEEGVSSIVAAASAAAQFEDPSATFLLGHGIAVCIAGVPQFGSEGFSGYQLLVSRRSSELTPPWRRPDPPPLDEAFGSQLGRAMREPLDRIIAHADNIVLRGDGPVRRDYAGYAEDIAGAGRHLLALVDDLVDLQTIESPDFRPDVERVDLVDAAQRAAGLLAVRAGNAHVTIDGPPSGKPVSALGDFRRILQVLINLLSNAIRHSPPGGTIWIRCEQEDGIAAVIVADGGDGIADGDHERIFERFERLGLRDGTGSGLGLYISRRLIRAMGGDLGVDSARGQGARFVLTLPGVE